MVGVEEKRQTESSESMAFQPERSRPLHNFNLPTLRWGAQRHLRCMKINDTNNPKSNPGSETALPGPPHSTTMAHHRSHVLNSPPRSNDDNGIEAVREKVMSDLRVAADRMKISMLEDKEKKQNQNLDQQQMAIPAGANTNANEPNSNSNSNSNSASARPCNLRTRRAACKEPRPPVAPVVESPRIATGGSNSTNKPPDSPVVTRMRGLAAAANTARQSLERGENRQKPRFSIELTREEIEHDFLLMTGKKPPRRPKKRTRNVQKKVDACCPGLWLSSDITPDSYKVPELPDSGKA